MRIPPFWPVTFYQKSKVNAEGSLGRGGRGGGGQFRRTVVRRNVGQRNRPGLFEAQADTARHSFRAARFHSPGTPGFRDGSLRAVYVGVLETNGLWDWVGFQKVPLRDVREGWMETKGPWERVGFRNRPLRAAREGWMETRGPWDRVGFLEGPLRAVREGWMETNPSKQGGGFRDMAWEDW